ncbi:MAG: putative ORFan [Satyrvirus sp.]|uniref:Putative ORFan n=1 Tax=Satyrvirus sp. TaxID=2487771 RepID=A0A3G5AIF2_9VIRU|nr:MAG: putative ORFan [Satyrvirus sp.]
MVLYFHWDKSSTTSINNFITSGYHIGVDGTKGFFLTIFHGSSYTSLSFDGIHNMINKEYNILTFILIRLIALFNVITYLVTGPIFLAVYSIIFILSLIKFALTFPFYIFYHILPKMFRCETLEMVVVAFMSSFIFIIGSIQSIFIIIGIFLLLLLHLILPEFTVEVLKMYLWGYILDYK